MANIQRTLGCHAEASGSPEARESPELPLILGRSSETSSDLICHNSEGSLKLRKANTVSLNRKSSMRKAGLTLNLKECRRAAAHATSDEVVGLKGEELRPRHLGYEPNNRTIATGGKVRRAH